MAVAAQADHQHGHHHPVGELDDRVEAKAAGSDGAASRWASPGSPSPESDSRTAAPETTLTTTAARVQLAE